MAAEDAEPDDAQNGEAASDGDPLPDGKKKPAPEPVPDVGAARAVFDAAMTLKGHMEVENSLLSVHVMRLMMRPRSGDSTPNSPSSEGRPAPIDKGLTMEERCEIAVAEIKIIQAQINTYRHESERMLDELQAAYDEAELRIGEVRRDIGDFRREVMAEAAERGARVASSEHVLKFLQDRIKTTRFAIVKRRERNATLHAYIAKGEAALEGKKDLADVLHAVDFDLLAIHKEQFEGQLRDRDKEMYKLKAEILKAEKALEMAQAQLGGLSEKYKNIKASIAERKPQLQRVKEDLAKELEKRAKAQAAYAQAVKDRDDSSGEKKPSVMEYLGLKKKVQNLQQISHTMHMKVEVADLTSTQLGIKFRKALRLEKE